MVDFANKNLIAIMDSSQVFLAKSILQALIHDVDLENLFQKAITRFVWKGLPAVLADYPVCLLALQQLFWWNQPREEETIRFGSVMQIYNPL